MVRSALVSLEKLNITIQSCPKELSIELSPVSQRQRPFAQFQRIRWDHLMDSHRNIHTLDVLLQVPLQMPPPPSFCVNIHALSYTIIFGVLTSTLTSTSYQSSQDSYHNLHLTHGGTIQQWGLEYVCLSRNSLSQFPFISHWSPTRSQSPLTENLITIIAFINIPIATHAIKGHATHFSECVVPFPTCK